MSRFRPLAALALFIALLASVSSSYGADPAPAADKDAILGQWKVDSMNTGGMEMTADELSQMGLELKFEPTTITSSMKGDNQEKVTYTLDAQKAPKQINVQDKDKPMAGIYELDGDTLTMSFSEDQKGPAPIDTKPGAGKVVIKLKRVK